MKFKAAILYKKNNPLLIQEISLKDPIGYGQILVKVKYSGICGSQIGEISGKKKDKFLPHLLGHEGYGKVVETGEGVKNVKIDDIVILHWKVGSGIQSKNPTYYLKDKPINAGWVTTFNQYAVVSENRVTKIQNRLKDSYIYPLFGCAVPTAFGAVENLAKVKFGQKIIIIGVGGIGLSILQACKFLNSKEIFCVDIDKKKLDFAKSLGATKTKLVSEISPTTKQKLIGNFDHCFENTGYNKNIEFGYDCINSKGKLILIGVPKENHKSKIFTLDLHFGKEIIGCHGGNVNPSFDIPRYINFFKNKQNELKKIITNKDTLDNINKTINHMKKSKIVGRSIISLW